MEANKETEKLLSPKRRSKGAERQKEEGGISGKDIAMFGAEMIPGVGEAMAVKRTSDALDEKDYLGAGIEATAGLLGIIPGVGDLAGKALKTSFKNTRKAYKLFVKGEDEKLYPLFVDANKPVKQGEFLEANFPDVAFKGKRKEGSKESFYVPTKGAKRTPTKYYLDDKEITKKEYNSLGPNAKSFSRVVPGEKTKGTGDSIIIPDEATRQKLINEGFITEKTRRTKEAPFGRVTAVAARPGWHASQAPVATHLGPQDLKINKKEAEKLVEAGVTPEAIKRRGNQFYVKRRAEDQVFAEVDMADDVDYQSMLAKEGKSDINDRVPKGGSYKYSDGQADSDQWIVGGDMKVNRVLSREETRAIQKEMGVVDLPYRDEVEAILGKKFAKGGIVMDDYLVGKIMDEPQNFAEGGMPVAKQMEMFEDGGLMDEGGTVDPVSGNNVPPGSTQEEVRDDIPAQLSEGEFVFPADVVRYIGLGNLMRMRQEAKMGLKLMDEMGQMGNSEEATMPDDLPFDINDLDMEDEIDDNNELEMQVGGFVQPTQQQQQMGISGYQQAAAPTTGVATAPTQAASQQYVQPVRPQQAAVPTMPAYQPSEIPTFKGFVGENIPGVEFEYVDYTNEAGNIIKLRKSKTTGELLDPVPEGYTFVDPEATKTEEVTTTPTTPQTTSVREDREIDRDGEIDKERERFARIQSRIDLAKQLGVTGTESVFEGIGGTFGSGYGPDMVGKMTGTGYIIGKGGVLIDPLTMSIQGESGSGGIVGSIVQGITNSGKYDKGAYSKQFYEALPDNIRENLTKENKERLARVEEMLDDPVIEQIIEESGDSGETTGTGGAKANTFTKKGEESILDVFKDFSTEGDSSDSGNNQNQSSGEGRTSSTDISAEEARGQDPRGESSYGGGYYRAKGGLIEKPKPKAKKKMKQGGLASKK